MNRGTLLLTRGLSAFLVFAFILNNLTVVVNSNPDSQCCRRKIECFECDSRFDARCGDPFNLTRDTATLIECNDLCVKLKHKFGNQFYYIRSCADTFKKIYIKKTDVCYSTRTKDGGYLCFCDQETCNNSNRLHSRTFTYPVMATIVSVLVSSKFRWLIS